MEDPARIQLGAVALWAVCQSFGCSPGTSPAEPTVRTSRPAETGLSGSGAVDDVARAGAVSAAGGLAPDASAADSGERAHTVVDTMPATPPELADEDAGVDPVTLRRHPPDANIHFDWAETVPGRKLCEPGHYKGSFMCDLLLDSGLVAHLKGPVELSLERSQDGEFLQLSDATIEGFALLIFNFRAALTGRLDCNTRQLDAMAASGAVGLGDADLLPVLGFEGQLHGTLDDAGDILSGDWSFPVTTSSARLGVCTGPWTATRVVP